MRKDKLVNVGGERGERPGVELDHDLHVGVPVGEDSLVELCLEGSGRHRRVPGNFATVTQSTVILLVARTQLQVKSLVPRFDEIAHD